MFFPRLRRQAKWMFVFLALVFGVGFVVFGVGGGIPGTSLGDILRDNSSTSGSASESELRDRIKENPNDADAYRELATNLQQDGDTQEAIDTLKQYAGLRPKDTVALGQLGSLYLAEANRLQAKAARAYADFQEANPGAFLPTLTANGRPVLSNQVTDPAARAANERYSRAYGDMQGAFSKAVAVYKLITKATPRDPQAQLQLAQTAQTANDLPAAIAAYKRFLALSPEDQNAPLIRQQISRLRSALQAQAAQQTASTAG
jgi:tetratricopeptide (TPR) repeat protein